MPQDILELSASSSASSSVRASSGMLDRRTGYLGKELGTATINLEVDGILLLHFTSFHYIALITLD